MHISAGANHFKGKKTVLTLIPKLALTSGNTKGANHFTRGRLG